MTHNGNVQSEGRWVKRVGATLVAVAFVVLASTLVPSVLTRSSLLDFVAAVFAGVLALNVALGVLLMVMVIVSNFRHLPGQDRSFDLEDPLRLRAIGHPPMTLSLASGRNHHNH